MSRRVNFTLDKMKLRQLDLVILEALEQSMLVSENLSFGYAIEDVIEYQSPSWKQTTLKKETIASERVSLIYATRINNRNVRFTVRIGRKEWSMLMEVYTPHLDSPCQSECLDQLPSYKDHPYFKRHPRKPAGKFMKPVDSQASKMYRKRFE